MSLFDIIREKLNNRIISFRVAVLVCFFGSGSWLAVNGIWVELSLLVDKSPQQWKLPSYLTVAIALANVGPVLYALGNRFIKVKGRKVFTEIPVTYGIILLGIVALLMLPFLWDSTVVIRGESYSASLISLTFLLAFVGCTSSVTFLPYMAKLKKEYMSIFFVGQGLSGLIPSLLALIQGVGEESYVCTRIFTESNITLMQNATSKVTPATGHWNKVNLSFVQEEGVLVPMYLNTKPRFSVQVFFLVLCLMMCGCLFAFICLNHLRIAICERSTFSTSDFMESSGHREDLDKRTQSLLHGRNSCSGQIHSSNPELVELASSKAKDSRSSLVSGDVYADCVVETDSGKNFSVKTIFILLVMSSVINALGNGILPSLQSYACLPYGNKVYHLALTLSAIANPVTCFLFCFLPTESIKKTMFLLLIYFATAAYTITIAATSPCPVLKESPVGGILIIFATVAGAALVSYIKTTISSLLRNQGHKSLVWCGISIQIGSCLGAVLMFPIVNVYKLFLQTVPCQKCL